MLKNILFLVLNIKTPYLCRVIRKKVFQVLTPKKEYLGKRLFKFKKVKKIMTGVIIIATAIVAMACVKGSNNNGKFFGSSTSMFFGNRNMNAGAAC